METNRKNRLRPNILKSDDKMSCTWFEKGWCCSSCVGQGSRRGIQETCWNLWGEIRFDVNWCWVNSSSTWIWHSFTLPVAATSGRVGKEHRDLLPIRGGQDKVILDGPKTGKLKQWSKRGLNKVISSSLWRGNRQSDHWLQRAKCSPCPF